jgi:membrane fusion protein, heavy metal efflux system
MAPQKMRPLSRTRERISDFGTRLIGHLRRRGLWPLMLAHRRGAAACFFILCIIIATIAISVVHRAGTTAEVDSSSQSRQVGDLYYPAAKQWASLEISTVGELVFRAEHLTEGKIAVDEDRATLVYSPYAGRVIKLLAKPGDIVAAGQPLFVVESPDMVQAQNDYITASASVNKARSALDLAKLVEQQNKSLYETKAGAQRDLQQAQAATLAAQNDLRSAQISVEAVRNRLRILGKTDAEITAFGEVSSINPQTTISSPIAGTVVQRKVGPGQYVNTTSNSAAASDATYVIGDLSSVWLVAYIRESEAPKVKVGQGVHFTVLAYPNRVFDANIDYVATSFDPGTRRLLVRATIKNNDMLLRPEMFASVTVLTGDDESSPAVPREAIIYEGSSPRVWVAHDDQAVEPRIIMTGLSRGPMVQVLSGLRPGDKVVTKGSLFIDRAAAGS